MHDGSFPEARASAAAARLTSQTVVSPWWIHVPTPSAPGPTLFAEPGSPWHAGHRTRRIAKGRKVRQGSLPEPARSELTPSPTVGDAWAGEVPAVRFRILGPLEVVSGDRLLELGRPKQRAVLAILLLNADRVVAVDRLIEELWDGQPPPQATASLQAYIYNLRRLLEPGRAARTPPRVLRSQP